MTNIEMENAELIMPFRNFSGKPSKYNAEGVRGFSVYIPEDRADEMRADGWNVKETKPRDYEEKGRPYINVAVNFEFRPPNIYVGTDPDQMHKVEEDSVGELDWADIEHVDLTIRPRTYDVNGKAGVKAYLAEMYVIISKSRFADKYHQVDNGMADEDIPF